MRNFVPEKPLPGVILADGWVPWIAPAFTYNQIEHDTYQILAVGEGYATAFSAGMKVRLTHGGATKYFIIMQVAAGLGFTGLWLYGGTDYTLAAGAITDFRYSPTKAPLGFPLDPTKWTVRIADTADRTQATPTGGTWYNVNAATQSLSVPIGAWELGYQALLSVTSKASKTYALIYATLSTANNSASDAEFSAIVQQNGASSTCVAAGPVSRRKHVTLAAKATYYLNISTSAGTDMASIMVQNAAGNSIIQALCAYL
jgi:hypothetical protein